MERKRTSLVVLLLAVATWASASQVRPAAEQTKIYFLLGEVKNSPAIFIRNGKEYPASRAASHLVSKLNSVGRWVQNARQFIVEIATHSEASGKPYEIRWVDGHRQPLAGWLLERLDFYEKEHLQKPDAAASH